MGMIAVSSATSRLSALSSPSGNSTIKFLETKLTELKKELEDVKKDNNLDPKVKKQKIQLLQTQIQLIELQIRQAQEAEKRKQAKQTEKGTFAAASGHDLDITI